MRTAGLEERERELAVAYHRNGDQAARQELVESMLPLVRHIASRYASRGEPFDDLVQVGCIGLVKAVDRYDIDRGVRLSTFAAPNIEGEIKRHFRDFGWTIRVPRDIQERHQRVKRATAELTVALGREPTPADLAEHLELEESAVIEALDCRRAYEPSSFDEPVGGGERRVEEVLGDEDERFEFIDDRISMRSGFQVLSRRDREIVRLRFVENLTQREIARRVGMSQMHVSRLLRRAIDQIRAAIDGDGSLGIAPSGS